MFSSLGLCYAQFGAAPESHWIPVEPLNGVLPCKLLYDKLSGAYQSADMARYHCNICSSVDWEDNQMRVAA